MRFTLHGSLFVHVYYFWGGSFTSKDGAFSFAEEVPGVFANASKAPGFVKITPLKASHRVNMKAELCEACRVAVFRY